MRTWLSLCLPLEEGEHENFWVSKGSSAAMRCLGLCKWTFFPFCKDKDHTVHQIADQNVPGGNKSHNFDPYHKSLLKHHFSAWLPYFPLTPPSSLSLFHPCFCIWLPTALGISLCAQPSKTLTIRCWSKRKRINLNLLVQGLLPLLLQDNTIYFNEYYLQNHAITVLLVWCLVRKMNERPECKLTSVIYLRWCLWQHVIFCTRDDGMWHLSKTEVNYCGNGNQITLRVWEGARRNKFVGCWS